MNILTCEGVCKTYGSGNNQVAALDGIDLAVGKGEFVAIIGASGSGKSTLLHILGGVDQPSSGKVFVDDIDVYAQKEDALAVFRRREVGLIYQFYNLIPVMDVIENITLPVLMDGKKIKAFTSKRKLLKSKKVRMCKLTGADNPSVAPVVRHLPLLGGGFRS